MPQVIDKIIINSNGAQGMDQAIAAELKTAQHLGAEILAAGWAKETTALRDKMAAACKKHRAAEKEYLEFMEEFNQELADFIDNHP